MIKSISYDQSEIIKWILQLHCPSGVIDLDPCYSVGNFYKKTGIKEPVHKFDIIPQKEGVKQASADNLPFKNEEFDCIMFDPPFLATKGKSLKEDNENNNAINRRFGVFPTEKELFEFYDRSLKEFYRILKQNGTLIFKCQDKVSSAKQYLSHVLIINEAIKIGYYPKDFFVLLAKNRIVADWQLKNQQHARKFHSYFIVFKKEKCKIKYNIL
jgi:SAM-dependent methyltransferase